MGAIEMRIYGIVPDKGPQVYNIAPSLIAEILDGCIPQSSSEFRDVYAAWMDRYAPGAMPPEEWTPDTRAAGVGRAVRPGGQAVLLQRLRSDCHVARGQNPGHAERMGGRERG